MAQQRYDLVVVGGGGGGLTAAQDARRRGARVLLVQNGPIGGDCTFTGCVPSKTLLSAAATGLDFSEAMARVRAVVAVVAAAEDAPTLARQGVEVIDGWARFTSPTSIEVDGASIASERFIVATGARPLVPPIPGLDQVPHLTSDNIFELADRPQSLAILGGGPIGCELAQAFARLGVAVTLVEGEERLLPREEPRASEVVTAALAADGVDVRVGAQVTAVAGVDGADPQQRGVRLTLEGGGHVAAAQLLVAVGRKPAGAGFGLEEIGVEVDRWGAVTTDDTMATTVDGIWAVGDCAGRLQLTHAAARMALIASRNALSPWAKVRKQSFDAAEVPWATFTDPEVGRIGFTEAEAADQIEGAMVAEMAFTHLDRAITAGRTEGFIKLIAQPRLGLGMKGAKLVGATVVGPNGGDLIAEAALAIRTGMVVGRLAQTVHVYPSWAMAYPLAAAQFFFESMGSTARPARDVA